MDLERARSWAAGRHQGVLTTIASSGRPQLSNIFYNLDPGPGGAARISVTATRAKTRNLRRDPRAALYVPGDNFLSYVVLEGTAELSAVAAEPDDATVDQLVDYYRAANGEHPDWDEYRRSMVAEQRLMIHLRPERAYGQLSS